MKKVLLFLIIAVLLTLAGLALLGKKSLRTEITIDAPIEVVWSALTELQDYQDWNPFIIEIDGEVEVGETLTSTIHQPGGNIMTFYPEVMVVEPFAELRWVGKPAGIPYIATGEHYFFLERLDEDTTSFVQGEDFSGMFVPFMGSLWDATELGFMDMNEAMKSYVEYQIDGEADEVEEISEDEVLERFEVDEGGESADEILLPE